MYQSEEEMLQMALQNSLLNGNVPAGGEGNEEEVIVCLFGCFLFAKDVSDSDEKSGILV